MQDYPRFTINRALITLLPKQPALDWIMEVDPNPLEDFTLEELRQDQDAFLIGQAVASMEDAEQWVYRRWKMFFELFLEDWFPDESRWPKNRTLKKYKEWFEVQYHSMVWDLSDAPIEHEDWE